MMQAVGAATVFSLIILSIIASYFIGDIPRIPMRWNSNWIPAAYAPKWVGLSIAPFISIIAVISLLKTRKNIPEKHKILDMLIVCSCLVAGHGFYLYLIGKWLATLS